MRTSCTNQAHYSLVRMCTPCSRHHPPPHWRSRSRVVVTSHHVLIGSGTVDVHTRSPLRHPSYSSLQTCSLCHHGSDWNLQTFHCFRYCIHAFAVQHTLQPSLAFCHTSTSLVPIPFPLLSPTSQGENNILL